MEITPHSCEDLSDTPTSSHDTMLRPPPMIRCCDLPLSSTLGLPLCDATSSGLLATGYMRGVKPLSAMHFKGACQGQYFTWQY